MYALVWRYVREFIGWAYSYRVEGAMILETLFKERRLFLGETKLLSGIP
jgi:hypothetical protein